MFRPLARASNLSAQVAGQLEVMIARRHLQSGERLPSERQLAEEFGVSRTVVREAVQALVAKNLLEVRTGSGTVICNPTAQSVARSMSLFLQTGVPEINFQKVVETRRILEVAIAGLAAERHTEQDLAELEEAHRSHERVVEDLELHSPADLEFHVVLARSTHNELFTVLLDSISDVLLSTFRLAAPEQGQPARSLWHHNNVLERVRAGDAAGARRAMEEHLREYEVRALRRLAEAAPLEGSQA
ncbi:MAG: FadR/GntR family transcriptional regulator [Chloroflexota bacterium]